MTWIKAIPISESDEKLRRAMEQPRSLSDRVCSAGALDSRRSEFRHCRVAQPDSRRSLSCICDVRIVDVAGVAFDPAAT
jgi:hypothetical protein